MLGTFPSILFRRVSYPPDSIKYRAIFPISGIHYAFDSVFFP
jgi:hypothetical protein